MDLRQATSQLILALEATKEFIELKSSVIELSKNPQHKKTLDDLRQLQKRLHEENLTEQEASRVMSEMSEQYNRLQGILEFERYFELSSKFDQLFAYVTEDIAKNLNNVLVNN